MKVIGINSALFRDLSKGYECVIDRFLYEIERLDLIHG